MRALTPWRPMRSLSVLHEDIDSLFNRLFGDEEGWLARPFAGEVVPAVESFMRGDELVLRADLPGIDPKAVELNLEGDRLTIKGERKAVEEDAEKHYREVAYGRFERTVTLPAGIDADSIKAAYRDGVLEVTMRAPKGLVSKKVSITVH